MKMNKEEYEKLLLRFRLELSEVGVTEDMLKIISAICDRSPNAASACADELTDKFSYRHKGYLIEAERTVKLVVKRCK
tara:strand:+ start:162 stop:395 length:234 start_codon:yes stop_codon:yes gene_type:complete